MYGRHTSVMSAIGASGTGCRVAARSSVRITSTVGSRVVGTLRVEGQGSAKRRRKLPDGVVAFAKEINGIIMAGPHEALGL